MPGSQGKEELTESGQQGGTISLAAHAPIKPRGVLRDVTNMTNRAATPRKTVDFCLAACASGSIKFPLWYGPEELEAKWAGDANSESRLKDIVCTSKHPQNRCETHFSRGGDARYPDAGGRSVQWDASAGITQARSLALMHYSGAQSASPVPAESRGDIVSKGVGAESEFATPTGSPATAGARSTPWIGRSLSGTKVAADPKEAPDAEESSNMGLPLGGGVYGPFGNEYDMMTPGITSKLTRSLADLSAAVLDAKKDATLTPLVLSSCTCSEKGAWDCPVHGPPGTWTNARMGPQAWVDSSPSGDREDQDTSIESDAPGAQCGEDQRDDFPDTGTPKGTTLLERFESAVVPSLCPSLCKSDPPDTASSPAPLGRKKRRKARSQWLPECRGASPQSPAAASLRLSEPKAAELPTPTSAKSLGRASPAPATVEGEMDIVIRVEPQWRGENGFQVYQVLARRGCGAPLRVRELLPWTWLGKQRKGGFRFARDATEGPEELESVWGAHTYAPADCTVKKRKRNVEVVTLREEQAQVRRLHEGLARALRPDG